MTGDSMVKVCDAIMGSGKSQSAIAYINAHPDVKFVYITPYLTEANRIADGCGGHHFVEPSDDIPDFHFSKLEHTRFLLANGYNVATTHAAFRSYTVDMIEAIEEHQYVLIIDEAVDVFQEAQYSQGDIQLLIDGGYITDNGGTYEYTGKEYDGVRLRDLFELLRCKNLIATENKRGGVQYYYWALPYEIMMAFSDVIILTYLFECSELKYFFEIYNISYENIGIRFAGGRYEFVDHVDYIPEYVSSIKSKVHIFYNEKLNAIGQHKNALSSNWMVDHKDGRETIKRNMYTYFRYHMNAKNNDIMWATYKKDQFALRGRGYSKQSVELNKRASNEYRGRTVLAYCVNLFPSPQKEQFFGNYGIKYDADGFALSTMIQWIWRSAIRDGHEIWIYIPSRRMRTLLEQWLDRLADGEDK